MISDSGGVYVCMCARARACPCVSVFMCAGACTRWCVRYISVPLHRSTQLLSRVISGWYWMACAHTSANWTNRV